ncbi:hypothetical protein RJ639_037946 [Escallonia herrerae]|uniref:RNase H type-1 domain-containing protein n=1 Tax=Escallonia herrerae TaxID=1293975 RepID=A0AA88WNF9_9ASTE|nr:hypothetical protein RJ639_037946 [Escallonia herrerae]
MPQCELYDGTGDPGKHVYQFETNMLLLQVSDAVMCRAFPTTLRKAAHAWKNLASLLNIVEEKNKSLAYFLGRFNTATLKIDDLHESVKYTAFLRGLRPTSKFAFSVNKSPPGNMKALLEKANKYIQAKKYLETHRERRGEGREEQKKRSRELTPHGGKSTKHSKRDEQRPKDPFALQNLTPLNAKPSQILHEIEDNKALQWPEKMRSRLNKWNKDLWCHFHNDHGHSTDNCESLKRAIEALIKRGQLRKFVTHKEGQQQTPPAMEEREDREENAGTMNTISGGLATKGLSGQARKAYAREVCVTSQPPNKKQKTMPVDMITFSGEDSKDIKTPHDDPLVITIKAGNFDVKHVLVSSAYNGILGRPALNRLQAVVSTYHLKMKFPKEHRIGKPQTCLELISRSSPIDRSSAIGSSGAVISPEDFVVEYTLRFGFQASNNEAEYEDLLAGIRLAHILKVDSLSVHSDSQLVVNHVLGDYEAKDERMAQYL